MRPYPSCVEWRTKQDNGSKAQLLDQNYMSELEVGPAQKTFPLSLHWVTNTVVTASLQEVLNTNTDFLIQSRRGISRELGHHYYFKLMWQPPILQQTTSRHVFHCNPTKK